MYKKRTMETPVEKCVAAVTAAVSDCCNDDGSLRRISTMWFAGMSENVFKERHSPTQTTVS